MAARLQSGIWPSNSCFPACTAMYGSALKRDARKPSENADQSRAAGTAGGDSVSRLSREQADINAVVSNARVANRPLTGFSRQDLARMLRHAAVGRMAAPGDGVFRCTLEAPQSVLHLAAIEKQLAERQLTGHVGGVACQRMAQGHERAGAVAQRRERNAKRAPGRRGIGWTNAQQSVAKNFPMIRHSNLSDDTQCAQGWLPGRYRIGGRVRLGS